MAALAPILTRLGLGEYIERFLAEGFDTWETLLDITESDLRELDVKLGHRRKLQREIAVTRGVGPDQTLDAHPPHATTVDGNLVDGDKVDEGRIDGGKPIGTGGKRKYRRHPKADENAPERAPSAYVIFSNKMREDLKPQNLSFTDIAKRVGEHWQQLVPEVKGQFETQAATAKEKYRADLELYKKTEKYREYNDYLAEFKQKNADDKRPRLEKEPSTTSSQSGPEQVEGIGPKAIHIASRHRRADSLGSLNTFSTTSEHPSPIATNNVSKPLPSLFTAPPYFRKASPTASATTNNSWTRRGSSIVNPVFAIVDKQPPVLADAPSRNPAIDRSEPRSTTSSHLANLMQDYDMLRARSSPLAMLPHEPSQSSNSSPISSGFSTTTNPLLAHSSSLPSSNSNPATTPPFDSLPNRRLPPLSTIVKPPSEGSLPPLTPSHVFPNLRPDFGPVKPPHSITTTTPSGALPMRNTQSPRAPSISRPSFKGEYEPNFKPGREANVKNDYDNEASPLSLMSDADPLSVLACAGRMVDREEQRVREDRRHREAERLNMDKMEHSGGP